jgi:hypothetical protein
MEREKLLELWDAANLHSVFMYGELIVETDDGDVPPAPSDAEIVAKVTQYLKDISQ